MWFLATTLVCLVGQPATVWDNRPKRTLQNLYISEFNLQRGKGYFCSLREGGSSSREFLGFLPEGTKCYRTVAFLVQYYNNDTALAVCCKAVSKRQV